MLLAAVVVAGTGFASARGRNPDYAAGERTAAGDDGSHSAVRAAAPARPPWSTRNAIPLEPTADDTRRFAAGAGDVDGDGVDDALDNCVTTANTDQADGDLDGIGDVCDSCPAAAQPRPPLQLENFESGAPGWTHESLGQADTWRLTDVACFSVSLPSTMYVSNGNAGPACSANSSHELSRLIGPPVTLPAAGSITLSFDVLAFDELGTCVASGDFDAKDVGISTDDGETYVVLNDCTALATTSGVLTPRSFDISAFAGQTVRVVFVYDTVDATAEDTFAVDNVSISSNAAPEQDVDADGTGDVCDPCPIDPANDSDADGLCAEADSCPTDFNPPAAPLVEDFESGAPGWTHAPRGAADTWALGSSSCFGDPLGSTMYVSNGNAGPTCTPSSSHEHSQLLGPLYSVPSGAFTTLTFETVAFDELGSCMSSLDFDAKDAGITADGGTFYTLLNDCVPLNTSAGSIVRHEHDLTPFAGTDIQLLFVYDTRDNENDHTFAVDNVEIRPGQPDLDGDAIGDPCDCAPSDPTQWDVPGVIDGLVFDDAVTLVWDPATTGTTNARFDVLRGTIGELPIGGGPGETCIEQGLQAPTAVAAGAPAAGAGFFYLVRPRAVCGLGSYGQTGVGGARVSNVCD